MKVQRVEDLECWRESRILVNMVFKKSMKRGFRKDTQLRNHVTGSVLDCMNYITEGFESRSDSEFVKTLKFGLRSLAEAQTTLYAALDLKYISKSEFMELYDQVQKTRKLVDGYRLHLTGRTGGGRLGQRGRRWQGRSRDQSRSGGSSSGGSSSGGSSSGGSSSGGSSSGGRQDQSRTSQQPAREVNQAR
jgi:four helix bundle protein